MTLRYIIFSICLLGCLWASPVLAQTLVSKSVPLSDAALFSNELRQVQIIVINSKKMLEAAQNQSSVRLLLPNGHDWQLELTADPIFTPNYMLTTATAEGLKTAPSERVQTFRGTLRGSAEGTCRLALAAGFIYGVFELNDKTYFIEPARRLNQNLGEDHYLFYESSDILPNANGRCAGALYEEHKTIVEDLEKSAGACSTVKVAIAADYQMLQLFGNEVGLLEKYVAAILNSVRTNYDDEFNFEIRFEINTLWVSTCAACDPWGTDTNYENLLAIFRDWGNANGFNQNFDVGTLWTGRVLDDNIGGGGYYGVLCGRLRYNMLRRYSENAGLMRALQAHELGHNLNARHDSTNSQTIMAPFIREVNAWSPMSRVSINNYFNIARGLPNCISECQEPAPLADFFALQSTGCAPLQVQFYNTSSANTTEWEWFFEGGNPATSNQVNPLVRFEQPGIYNITLKSGSENGTSQLTKSAFIEVKGTSEPTFHIDYQAGATIAHFSTTVAADSIRWVWGEGHSSTEPTFSFDFERDGSFPISLITFNECGSDTLTKIVNIITPPQAGFSAANFVGCAPLRVQFNNESSANAVEFAWQFSGGTPTASNEKNPTVVFARPGIYSVTLVARNAAGEVTKRLNNLIQVNDAPSAAFSITADANAYVFRNLTQGEAQFQWDFGDGTTSAEVNPMHLFTSAGAFDVQLIAKNSCGADTSAKTVQILGLPPTVAFTADQQVGCAPLLVQFTDQTANEPETWQWFFPGAVTETSEEQHPTVTYREPGIYEVKLITTNFFGSDTLVESHWIEVAAPPSADFNPIIQNQQVKFQLAQVVQRGWEYEWYFGDGNTSQQPKPEHIYANSGEYAVDLIVKNACGTDTIRKMVQIGITQTKEQAQRIDIRLYPNPNDGRFQLLFQNAPQQHFQLRIINALGQELARREVEFTGKNGQQSFDFQHLAEGVYWIELRSDTGMTKKAFILQRP